MSPAYQNVEVKIFSVYKNTQKNKTEKQVNHIGALSIEKQRKDQTGIR